MDAEASLQGRILGAPLNKTATTKAQGNSRAALIQQLNTQTLQ